MVKTYIQYWYALTIDVEEAFPICENWIKGQKGAKFIKEENDDPEFMSFKFEQGSAMKGYYKPEHKKRTYISFLPVLPEWNCDPSAKIVMKLQSQSSQVGAITKKKHLKVRPIWQKGYFQVLFDKLGGTPLQILIETGKKKDGGDRVIVRGDGSLPQDYDFIE